MKLCFIILFLAILNYSGYAQQIILMGTVKDQATSKELSYANIRVKGTAIGTSANIEGNFELRLEPNNYTLITSFIGYKSDTTVDSRKHSTAAGDCFAG